MADYVITSEDGISAIVSQATTLSAVITSPDSTSYIVSGSPAGPSNVTTSTATNITGILKGDGTSVSAAIADTDYQDVLAEGAFADGDKTKLDGIEALADVTDTTNVTSAGALMDSELTSIASVKALNQGVATTDSPTFVGGTFTGTLAGRDQTLTVANTDNKVGLTVTQNDTTNNPNGVTVTNAGTGYGLFVDQNGNGRGIYVDSEATTQHVAYVEGVNTAASVIYALGTGANTTAFGSVARFQASNASHSNPVVRLDNAGSGYGLYIDNNGNGNAINIDHDGNSASAITGLHVNVANAGAGGAYAAIFEAGNVGIGTTAPTALLTLGSDVTDGNNLRMYYKYPSLTIYGELRHGGNDEGLKLLAQPNSGANATSGDITFYTASDGTAATRKMTLKNNGKLGIGTYTPSEALTVAGNVTSTTDSTYTLGTSSLYWSNTYTDRLYVNSTAYIDGASAGTAALTGALSVTGANGTLTLSAATDGGEFNIGASATGTLALYGSAGSTLHVNLLDGNLTVAAGSLIKATSSPPASAGATGTTGQIEWDSSYIYICIASNTWQRVAHATW